MDDNNINEYRVVFERGARMPYVNKIMLAAVDVFVTASPSSIFW